MSEIIDLTVQNFQAKVMDASETRPVVVTFSSSQMPECAAYNALLEKLSGELDFSLGKVNLDEPDNGSFIQMFRIRDLPFVGVISKGEMADAIQGNLPEADLRKRLEKFFVSDEERAKRAIEDAVAEGDFATAKPAIAAALKDKPEDDHLKLLLAKCELGLGNPEESKAILSKIAANSEEHAAAKSLLDLMDLLVEAAKTDPVSGDAKTFRDACKDAARKDYRSALESLFELVLKAPEFKEGAAKKAMVVLFGALGPKDALVWEYRAKLSNALFI